MLNQISKIVFEILSNFKNRHKWRSISKSGTGRTMLVIGNGPSVSRLDVDKMSIFAPSHSTDIAFVNGFLYSPPFNIEDYKCFYFISDPYILRLINWIRNGGDREKLSSKPIIQALFHDAEAQAIHSLQYDSVSLVRALSIKNLTWFTPVSFVDSLRHIGINNVFPLSRLVIPQSWPLILHRVVIALGYYGPNHINPLGPAVINSAILAGISMGYERIIVVGHNDELDYKNFSIRNNQFYFKYRYYWEDKDREYLRNDSWESFREAQFKNILLERYLQSSTNTEISYIAPSHLHLFLTRPGGPDILREIE